jgi:hypothetical protein
MGRGTFFITLAMTFFDLRFKTGVEMLLSFLVKTQWLWAPVAQRQKRGGNAQR